MTSGRDIQAVLTAASSLSRLLEMGDALVGALPPGHRFEDDDWNVISWKRVRGRARELFLHFGEFRNVELRDVVKVYLLHCRAVKSLSGATLMNTFRAVQALDQVIPQDRSVLKLSNDDFNKAQVRLLGETRSVTHNRFMLPKHLTGFGRFLNGQLGIRISFIHTASMGPNHGASGTSAAQEAKLIPLEVLRDLLLRPVEIQVATLAGTWHSGSPPGTPAPSSKNGDSLHWT